MNNVCSIHLFYFPPKVVLGLKPMRMLHLGKQINKLPEVFDNNAENSGIILAKPVVTKFNIIWLIELSRPLHAHIQP